MSHVEYGHFKASETNLKFLLFFPIFHCCLIFLQLCSLRLNLCCSKLEEGGSSGHEFCFRLTLARMHFEIVVNYHEPSSPNGSHTGSRSCRLRSYGNKHLLIFSQPLYCGGSVDVYAKGSTASRNKKRLRGSYCHTPFCFLKGGVTKS